MCACEYVCVVLHTDYTTEHRFIYLHVFSWMYYCRIICLFIHPCKIFVFFVVHVCACVCETFLLPEDGNNILSTKPDTLNFLKRAVPPSINSTSTKNSITQQAEHHAQATFHISISLMFIYSREPQTALGYYTQVPFHPV